MLLQFHQHPYITIVQLQWNDTFSVVKTVTVVLSMYKLEGMKESGNTVPFMLKLDTMLW